MRPPGLCGAAPLAAAALLVLGAPLGKGVGAGLPWVLPVRREREETRPGGWAMGS